MFSIPPARRIFLCAIKQPAIVSKRFIQGLILPVYFLFLSGCGVASSNTVLDDPEKHAMLMQLLRLANQPEMCAPALERLCGSEPDREQCISTNKQHLSCCATSVTQTAGSPLQRDTLHEGLMVPAGSMITYDSNCMSSAVSANQPMRYHDVLIEAADGQEIEIPGGATPLFAVVSGNQELHGLKLRRGKSFARFHGNGMPMWVSLAGESKQNELWFKPMEKRGGGFAGQPAATDLTELHANGRVAVGNLSRPSVINGIEFAPGVTKFHDTGTVAAGRLLQSQRLGKVDFPAYSRMSFSASEEPVSFMLPNLSNPENTPELYNIDGLMLRTQKIKVYSDYAIRGVTVNDFSVYRGKLYPPSTKITFNSNGSVASDSFYDEIANPTQGNSYRRYPRILQTVETIGDITLPAGSFVYSSRSGEVGSIVLPQPLDYAGLTFGVGKISLFKDGAVSYGRLENDQAYNGIHISSLESISFHSNGKLKKVILAKDSIVGDIGFKSGSTISFDTDGNVETGVLADAAMVFGFQLPESSHLTFYQKVLRRIRTNRVVKLNGIDFDGRLIEVRSRGVVRTGILERDTVFDGTTVPAGTRVLLSPDGELWRTDFIGKKKELLSGVFDRSGRQVYRELMDRPSRKLCNELKKQNYRTGGPGGFDFSEDCRRYPEFQDQLKPESQQNSEIPQKE